VHVTRIEKEQNGPCAKKGRSATATFTDHVTAAFAAEHFFGKQIIRIWAAFFYF